MKKSIWSLAALASVLAFSSCEKDDDTSTTTPSNTGTLTMNITGLEDLGPDYRYEGWIIVNGSPVSTGLFDIDANGAASATSFSVGSSDLSAATTYVLTIEPADDPDPAPSDVHILGGDFSMDNADVSVGHAAALGDDYSASIGGYILATPTDGMMNNENSGVWFLDPALGPGPALDLPTLPAGWAYEGWAVIDGTPVSTGTFTDLAAADASAAFSGMMAGPPFPGEDFLNNAPAGLSFPTDLAGATMVISIEPVPDNSPSPFTLKPLAGQAPSGAVDHTLYMMDNNIVSFPSGSVSR